MLIQCTSRFLPAPAAHGQFHLLNHHLTYFTAHSACPGEFQKNYYLDEQLFEAVKSSDIKQAETLISQGADPNATDKNKATVLMWAVYKSNFEIL